MSYLRRPASVCTDRAGWDALRVADPERLADGLRAVDEGLAGRHELDLDASAGEVSQREHGFHAREAAADDEHPHRATA